MSDIILEPSSYWQKSFSHANQMLDRPVSPTLLLYLSSVIKEYENKKPLQQPSIALWIDTHRKATVDIKSYAESCLITAGLFPNSSQDAGLSLPIYCHMGITCYKILHKTNNTGIYFSIADNFICLMDIMLFIQSMHAHKPLFNPNQAKRIWEKTKSQYAKELVKNS